MKFDDFNIMVKDIKVKSIAKGIGDFMSSLLEIGEKKVSLVIPAFNEEKTLSYVIKQAQLVKEIEEIIVVDDGSKDKTGEISRNLGVEVVSHHENLGKGEALKTGIAHASGEIILFLDADLKNITDKKIRALILPILKNKADFTKASFTRSRGRVTEFAVKPMMKVLYPDQKFKQPISGQFAGRKSFLKDITIEPKWGIDIAIFLDAIEQGQRVVEINIGELVHKKSPDEEIAKMSGEVMETMLRKSGLFYNKHKLIIFSEGILFRGFDLKEDCKLFLETLMKKRIKIALLTTKNVDSKLEYFNTVKRINSTESGENILYYVKKIAKKNDLELKDCVLVASRAGFEYLANEVDVAFCFENSPIKLKEKCKIISSLSDVLMHLE